TFKDIRAWTGRGRPFACGFLAPTPTFACYAFCGTEERVMAIRRYCVVFLMLLLVLTITGCFRRNQYYAQPCCPPPTCCPAPCCPAPCGPCCPRARSSAEEGCDRVQGSGLGCRARFSPLETTYPYVFRSSLLHSA